MYRPAAGSGEDCSNGKEGISDKALLGLYGGSLGEYLDSSMKMAEVNPVRHP